MESKSVKNVDVFNIIKYVFKRWYVVALIAILFAGALGGKRYFDYKVQKLNELYANANKVNLCYGSYTLYIKNFDGSENYYNRIEDVTAVVKSYRMMSHLKEEYKLDADFNVIANSITTVPVGINLLEVSIEGRLLGLDYEKVVEATDDYCYTSLEELENAFGKDCVVLVDEPRSGAYELTKALKGEEGDIKLITKSNVVKFGILGGMIGVIAGIVFVVFFALLSTLLRTKDEVIECYGVSLLGTVDHEGKDKEEYKRIINRLADKKSVALVSVSDQEYRSEMADNLAKNMAVNGKKVLSIKVMADNKDTDANVLYQYVVGKKSAKDLVAETQHKGLAEMVCSQATDESIDLFTNSKFVELMKEFSNTYDYVLVDCPAAKDYATCLSIAPLCDAVVAVGSINAVKEADVNKVKYNFKENNIEYHGLIYVG